MWGQGWGVKMSLSSSKMDGVRCEPRVEGKTRGQQGEGNLLVHLSSVSSRCQSASRPFHSIPSARLYHSCRPRPRLIIHQYRTVPSVWLRTGKMSILKEKHPPSDVRTLLTACTVALPLPLGVFQQLFCAEVL